MASIKVKFRPSINENKEGTIYYQIIQNRVIRQLKTDYRLFMHEWNEYNNVIIATNNSRLNYLQSIEERIDWDIKRLQSIINHLGSKRQRYTTDDIISTFQKQANEQSLFNFMQGVIAQLRQMGKQRTSETYRCTLKSFMQFRKDKDVLLADIDSDLMLMYEAYLHNRGLTKNSTSFYMRILRAVYNRAVEKDLTINRNPFKHVYTGIDKTIKRAIPLKAIKQIKNLDLSLQPSLDFARDMFLFGCYTGVSYADVISITDENLYTDDNGALWLKYRRKKNEHRASVKLLPEAIALIEKYHSEDRDTLFPLLRWPNLRRHMKALAALAGIKDDLCYHQARHSFASLITLEAGVPIETISRMLGHSDISTTQVYARVSPKKLFEDMDKFIEATQDFKLTL